MTSPPGRTRCSVYYAGTRPGETVELRRDDNLDLPEAGWGTICMHGNAPSVGAGWSDSGRRRDPRPLKHRAREEVRPVPCHPALTAYLRWHMAELGIAPDGRLFRGERGGDLSESVYQRAWQGARLLALPRSWPGPRSPGVRTTCGTPACRRG